MRSAYATSTRYEALFSPWTLRGLTLPNRLVFAPMSVGYASEDGFITERMIDHYAQRAKGGAALIVTEHTAVSVSGRQMPRQTLASERIHVPGLRRLADAVHEQGARLIGQIGHAGRYAGPWDQYEDRRRLAPSAVPFPLTADRIVEPQEITRAEIEAALEAFVTSAGLLQDAGFDGVQIHGSQGFLPSQFLSPRMNHRTDAYGGSYEGRTRFLREILQQVRDHIDSEFVLGVQLLADEIVEGGWALHEAVKLASQLGAWGVDFVLPTVTTFETGRMHKAFGDFRSGYQIGAALATAAACDIAVVANGGLRDPLAMEHLVADGYVEAIGLARPLLADPAWPLKVREGREDAILACPCSPPRCLQTQLTGVVCSAWTGD